MITSRQAQRDATDLLRLSLADGALDEGRVREIVQRLTAAATPAALAILSRYERLLRLEVVKHSATVASAAALPDDMRAELEASITRLYGPGIHTTFTEDPALLGGIRITVGSDVYDASIRGRLAALEARF